MILMIFQYLGQYPFSAQLRSTDQNKLSSKSMENDHHSIHTETRYDDLVGAISVNFRQQEGFDAFAANYGGIDISRYQPIAMRIYADKETILTIYAVDRTGGWMQSEAPLKTTGKVPVKKFKVTISLQDLFNSFRQFDFTLVTSGYHIEELEITQ